MTGAMRPARHGVRNLAVAAIVALAAFAAAWSWRAADAVRDARNARALASRVHAIQPAHASEALPCPGLRGEPKPVVLLALGQSNAGNHGEEPSRAKGGVVWDDGRCYAIADPLPGATGSGGSIWSRLAAMLADDVAPASVELVVLAVDATSVDDWTTPGPLRARLDAILAALRASGVDVSAVLWQQGESDAMLQTPPERYAAALASLVAALRRAGVQAPVLIARSTRCGAEPGDAIRDALAHVAAGGDAVHPGPDTDALGDDLRVGGCHFNARGLDAAARLWRDALLPELQGRPERESAPKRVARRALQ